MQERFKKGKQAHYQIEARLKKIKDEEAKTYVDSSLPFDIIYHADLFDPVTRVVYDVKPAVWLANNLYYCLCQISGYAHFMSARAMGFVQYERKGDEIEGPWITFIPSELRVPWSHLREIALKSDEMLLANKPGLAPETS